MRAHLTPEELRVQYGLPFTPIPGQTLSFDLETHLIQPGLLTPPAVCGSAATADVGSEALLSVEGAKALFRWALLNGRLEGANTTFDVAVEAAEDPTLTDLIFQAYEEGRVDDVLTNEALQAIGKGHLFKDPRTMGDLRDPETNKVKKRYSLAIVADHRGISVQKGDTYRLKYASLAGVPFELWPESAREYPKKDARVTRDVGVLQEGGPNMAEHIRRHENQAALALHLAGVWGIRTDPKRVNALAERVEAEWARDSGQFKTLGFIRPDGTENQSEVRKAVAKVYGATSPCDTCNGSGKGISAKTGKPIVCVQCGGTGLSTLGTNCPRTDPSSKFPNGQISMSRDTLVECGDATLETYGELSVVSKLRETYIPYLQRGTKIPLNLVSNVLVASGRVSYDELIQLLPRQGGIRDCFIAREGYVFCSVDYSALELCTLAQVHIEMFGRSALADAINRGEDLHTRLAATMNGIPYEELLARVEAKDPVAKSMRQMAKAANFGFPGGMGAAKVVFSARKDDVRFCELAGVNPEGKCGHDKWTEYKRKLIPPTCGDCIKVAEKLRRGWFAAWPEMQLYFDKISLWTEGADGGSITSLGNGMVRGGVHFTDGSNHRFQNLAAQGAKHALWLVSKECYTNRRSPLWGSRPVAFVHDEIFSELVWARRTEAAFRKAELMIYAMRKFCPDVLIGAKPAIARYWYKDMSDIMVDGELQEWEPPCPVKACKADGWKKSCAPTCATQTYPQKRKAA